MCWSIRFESYLTRGTARSYKSAHGGPIACNCVGAESRSFAGLGVLLAELRTFWKSWMNYIDVIAAWHRTGASSYGCEMGLKGWAQWAPALLRSTERERPRDAARPLR